MLASISSGFEASSLQKELDEFKRQIQIAFEVELKDSSIVKKLQEILNLFDKAKSTENLSTRIRELKHLNELSLLFLEKHRHSLSVKACEELESIAEDFKSWAKFLEGANMIIEAEPIQSIVVKLQTTATGLELIAEVIASHWRIFSEAYRQELKVLVTEILKSDFEKSESFIDEALFEKCVLNLRSSAGFILWKIEHGQTNCHVDFSKKIGSYPKNLEFSYKKIYEQIGEAAQSPENQRFIEVLRSWREEYSDNNMLDNE